MFDAYRRFFAFAGKQAGTWKKGLVFEFLRSIFEAFQFIALLIVLRALVEQNVTAATAWVALGTMAVSVAGAALFWYLAHNSEGQANYRMCGDKGTITPLKASSRTFPGTESHFSMADTRTLVSMTA